MSGADLVCQHGHLLLSILIISLGLPLGGRAGGRLGEVVLRPQLSGQLSDALNDDVAGVILSWWWGRRMVGLGIAFKGAAPPLFPLLPPQLGGIRCWRTRWRRWDHPDAGIGAEGDQSVLQRFTVGVKTVLDGS